MDVNVQTLLRQLPDTEPKLSLGPQKPELISEEETISGVVDGGYDAVHTQHDKPPPKIRTLPAALLVGDVKEALEGHVEWAFDVWKLAQLDKNDGPLVLIALQIFKDHDLCETFNIPEAKLVRWLRRTEEGYNAVPYHNSVHAADVLQTFNHFLMNGGMLQWMSPLELFASLFSCIVHDFKHPGVNNNFLALTEDMLALRYNDKSILENHHVAEAFLLVRDESINVLEGLQGPQRAEFRSLCISLVLATDMAHHFNFVGFMKQRLEAGGVGIDLNSAEDRCLAMKLVLKSADVSNPAKPLAVVKTWTLRVMEEFFNQGDLEKEKGLAVSPLCDRETVSVPASQTGSRNGVSTRVANGIHQVRGDTALRSASHHDALCW
eukprot:CAMPEP_0181391194 /NCGR_PEP_ID=MMETSP1106-20121128/25907_1 /TAXON_ID=81844 /ORGANISM="Mantoniella antarctica, Strain SL-175" /LENGTH=377 /DNA_ID=CAMNT_0023512193 /DNA_START=91 /DNA_END=1220 /DNA_ORIENTATION=-